MWQYIADVRGVCSISCVQSASVYVCVCIYMFHVCVSVREFFKCLCVSV